MRIEFRIMKGEEEGRSEGNSSVKDTGVITML